MALKVIGAGLGRTGTYSLKLGLEQLLGGPCYHMSELFQHPEHVPIWKAAILEESVDWSGLFEGYQAGVDWPTSAFWPELSLHYPDALIVFSRRDPKAWWESARSTIFSAINSPKTPEEVAWLEMVMAMFERRFTQEIQDREACIAAFKQHEKSVISGVHPDRLLVWEVKDGWEPICSRLNLPIPAEPFPRVNTREDFIAQRLRE